MFAGTESVLARGGGISCICALSGMSRATRSTALRFVLLPHFFFFLAGTHLFIFYFIFLACVIFCSQLLRRDVMSK